MKLGEKGAVPIPYIIALVLGVVVIALIGYWLFVSGGEFGVQMAKSKCDAKKLVYCNDWAAEGKKPGNKEFCHVTLDSYAPECCVYYTTLTRADCGIA